MKRLLYIFLILGAILAVFQSASVLAAITAQMNYQGKLTNASDVTVANGSYNFRFRLCTASDCAGGGDPIWTETRCYSPDNGATCDGTGVDQRLVVASGQFNAMLGSITSLAAIDFNQALYLEVQVGGSAATPSWETLTPRKLLGAVPGAFEATKISGKAETALATLAEDETVTGAYSFTKAGTALSVTNTASIGTLNLTNALGTLYGGTGATSLTNLFELNTHTTGNYVASANTSVLTGLTGGSAGSEAAGLTLALDYSQALTGDVGLATNAAVFGQSGLVFEGVTADTIETYFVVTDPTVTDRTFTLPDRSGTISVSGDTFTGDVTGTLNASGATALTIATATAFTWTANHTWQKADPSLILDVVTATDTDFWLGVQDDAGGDDDDKFQIGDGTTPGTNPFLTIDTAGNVGIGNISPATKLDVTGNALITYSTASAYGLTVNNSSATGYAARFQVGGTSVFTIGDPVITASIPLSVTAAGDTGIAYDLILTNIESANIKSQGPLYITAGDPNHNENLILTASGSGKVVLNDEAHIATRLNVARVPTGNDSLYAAAFQGAVCIDDTTANCPTAPTSGTIYTEGAALSSFDLAEMYATADATLEPGDLVSFSNEAMIDDLPFVTKSAGVYQPGLMGIVSTKPGITLGYPQISPAESLAGIQNKLPVALSGRVPTKVTTENGPIAIGDPLTSSSTPGVAMKATEPGMIVGFALEPFGEVSSMQYTVSSIDDSEAPTRETDSDILNTTYSIQNTADAVGTVLAFVNVIYYVPPVTLASVESAASEAGESLIDGFIQMVRDTWDLMVAKLTTNELTIKNPADGAPGLAGSGTLPANAASIVITNANVLASSKIFVTFKGALIGPWWISDQQAGGFTISVSGPQQTAVPFDYFILQVSGPAAPPAQAPNSNTQIPNNAEPQSSTDQSVSDIPDTGYEILNTQNSLAPILEPAPSSQPLVPDTAEPAPADNLDI